MRSCTARQARCQSAIGPGSSPTTPAQSPTCIRTSTSSRRTRSSTAGPSAPAGGPGARALEEPRRPDSAAVIGLLGGLGAALSWTVAALTAARASRAIKATPTLGWVMLIGLILILPTLAFLDPGKLSGRTVAYLALAGTANVAGLALEYLALRVGKIGVVAPLCSTEGAIGAVIAAIFGQVPSTGVLITLAVIAVGVVLSATADDSALLDGAAKATHPTRAAFLAMGSAILFGINLYALARAGNEASVVWTIWPARLVGTFAVAIPLALRSKLTLPRRV